MEHFCASLPTLLTVSVLINITDVVSKKRKAATPDEVLSNTGATLSEGL